MQDGTSHDGSGLVNLIAEIERVMTGESQWSGLSEQGLVPKTDTIVLILFDGLGVAQLDHDGAGVFRSSLAAKLYAPFPTTTSVSLATLATGLTPSQHGQVAHLSWMPDLSLVVNTLKWVTTSGQHVSYDYAGVLPQPNLWERLRSAGIEPITVQPGDFAGSPLSRVIYRGARFEGAWDTSDLVDATVSLATEPGRLVFTYVPFVDVAGHVHGQGSDEFTEAMRAASAVWEGIASALPPNVALMGTADHGLMEVTEEDKILVRDPVFDGLRLAGDARGVHMWGDHDLMGQLTEAVGGEQVAPLPLLGPDPSALASSRVGEQLLLAPPGKVVLPRGFDKRLRCYHGGLSPEEVRIPLLLG
ncbi:MAG: alkaline phosphatase family protein [Acidimicrobiia bacterium]|jgi:hypothetical protein